MIRALAILLVVTAASAEPRQAPVPVPIEQLKRWLWPRSYAIPLPDPPDLTPILKPVEPPKPAPVAKPPVPKKTAPAARPKPKTTPAKPAKTTAYRPPEGMCSQLRMGVAMIGRAGVFAEARRRGYSDTQIRQAASACGV